MENMEKMENNLFLVTVTIDEAPDEQFAIVEKVHAIGVFDSKEKAKYAGKNACKKIESKKECRATYDITELTKNKHYSVNDNNVNKCIYVINYWE